MIKYTLIGVDENANAIIAYVVKAMKAEKMSAAEISAYIEKAKSKSYTHLMCASIDVLSKLNRNDIK